MNGYSVPNLLGGTSYYNNNGEKVGESIEGLFGNTVYFNEDNIPFAESIPNMFGGNDIYPTVPLDDYGFDF